MPEASEYQRNGADKHGRIGLDAPRVTEDQATELMVHHLQMAAMYYEATPENEANVREEVERLMRDPSIPGHDGPDLVATRAWLTVINQYYARLKREQGD